MFEIRFDNEIREAAPALRVIAIEAEGTNEPTSDELWEEIQAQGNWLKKNVPIEQVNKLPGILPTRLAYKACGKEPNRYRPSAEALTRRMVKGVDLYRTLKIIDLINLLSLRSGHSIGGFDADKIEGTILTLGVGKENEPFEAIGRGPLNIAHLPIYRDAIGGIGTPTSDCERTKLSPDTSHMLMLVNVYDPNEDIENLREQITALLPKYGLHITNIDMYQF